MCEICSKLPIKAPEGRRSHHSSAFFINFEQISQNVLVFPLLKINKEMMPGKPVTLQISGSIVDFCEESFSKT